MFTATFTKTQRRSGTIPSFLMVKNSKGQDSQHSKQKLGRRSSKVEVQVSRERDTFSECQQQFTQIVPLLQSKDCKLQQRYGVATKRTLPTCNPNDHKGWAWQPKNTGGAAARTMTKVRRCNQKKCCKWNAHRRGMMQPKMSYDVATKAFAEVKSCASLRPPVPASRNTDCFCRRRECQSLCSFEENRLLLIRDRLVHYRAVAIPFNVRLEPLQRTPCHLTYFVAA